ncbi:hypothetical protein V5738_07745 [Salinisphaera sp. SPP-AMP-43]|uniref:hypothetical protein n=1 Tax=Salinisphaera sp. SPP-AMP-43 TaxID=3121288 RepID=UPI003C6DEADA
MKNIDIHKARTASRSIVGSGVAVVLAAALTGCAGTPDCFKNQSYTDAQTFPKLKNTAGLSVPASDPDMQIPAVSGGPVAAYKASPQGTDSENPQSRCLTTPPPLSPSRDSDAAGQS